MDFAEPEAEMSRGGKPEIVSDFLYGGGGIRKLGQSGDEPPFLEIGAGRQLQLRDKKAVEVTRAETDLPGQRLLPERFRPRLPVQNPEGGKDARIQAGQACGDDAGYLEAAEVGAHPGREETLELEERDKFRRAAPEVGADAGIVPVDEAQQRLRGPAEGGEIAVVHRERLFDEGIAIRPLEPEVDGNDPGVRREILPVRQRSRKEPVARTGPPDLRPAPESDASLQQPPGAEVAFPGCLHPTGQRRLALVAPEQPGLERGKILHTQRRGGYPGGASFHLYHVEIM